MRTFLQFSRETHNNMLYSSFNKNTPNKKSLEKLQFDSMTMSIENQEKPKALLLEGVNAKAVEILTAAGWLIDFHKKALSKETLLAEIHQVCLFIRCKSNI
jgi:hypothetical protein